MNPDMTTKLTRIKSALRESIEIANKATEGPWTWTDQQDEENELPYVPQCSYLGDTLICLADTYENSREDCAFLAYARTMTPLACKALLTAIEGLEQTLIGIGNTDDRMSDENSFIVNSMGYLVEKALSSITSEWPDV